MEQQIKNSQDPRVETKESKSKSVAYLPYDRIKEFLERHYRFRYNTLSNNIEFALLTTDGEVGAFIHFNDAHFNSIHLKMQQALDFRVNGSHLRTILNSDFVVEYNPFSVFINSLPQWEQEIDYIQMIAELLPTDDPEHRNLIFKKWFVGLVACGINPKSENQGVLMLKGGQGIGKTNFLRRLLPDHLSDYLYEGDINPSNKDHARLLGEKITIIIDEFDTKSERQSDSLKSFITRSKVTIRKPYATNSVNIPRVASICGTTNRDAFLKDPTGSRRFYIINVIGEINYHAIPEIIIQAYQQAYHLYTQGFEYFLTREEIERINEKNKEFQESSLEEDLLSKSFRPPTAEDQEYESLTATDIAYRIGRERKLAVNSRLVQKVGEALIKSGFKSYKSNGAKKYKVVNI